jgi:hypothetical protein
MLMRWRHVSGFNIHNGVKIDRKDEKGREALAQYIIRNPFSLEKIRYIEKSGSVIYRSAMSHGKSKKNFEIFDAEEFIATITQHIPDKSFQLVRYYGWYSNRSRGNRRKQGLHKSGEELETVTTAVEVLNISEHKVKKIPSKTWRECIKKVWEVDPLECPKCGSEMKIISFIDEHLLIHRILDHLGLWQVRIPKGLPPPVARAPETIVCEEFDDGWGHNSNPDVTLY